MKPIYLQIIETGVVLLFYVVMRTIILRWVRTNLIEKAIQKSRGLLIGRAMNSLLTVLCILFIAVIWGVQQNDIALFLGSALTLLGVGFFAQWSILSNITASIVLFFKHPAKIGDDIAIMEGKDYVIEGRIKDIGLFFTIVSTSPDDKELTLPNNVFMIKNIKVIQANELEEQE
ncbi:MAG: mechanosensitive ion channel domain-containing protein [Nonlabens sp.]